MHTRCLVALITTYILIIKKKDYIIVFSETSLVCVLNANEYNGI